MTTVPYLALATKDFPDTNLHKNAYIIYKLLRNSDKCFENQAKTHCATIEAAVEAVYSIKNTHKHSSTWGVSDSICWTELGGDFSSAEIWMREDVKLNLEWPHWRE